jgi:hypothetical protein
MKLALQWILSYSVFRRLVSADGVGAGISPRVEMTDFKPDDEP